MMPATAQALDGNNDASHSWSRNDISDNSSNNKPHQISRWKLPLVRVLSRERLPVHGGDSSNSRNGSGSAVDSTSRSTTTLGGPSSSSPLSARAMEKQRKQQQHERDGPRYYAQSTPNLSIEVLEDLPLQHPASASGGKDFSQHQDHGHPHRDRSRPPSTISQPQQEANSTEDHALGGSSSPTSRSYYHQQASWTELSSCRMQKQKQPSDIHPWQHSRLGSVEGLTTGSTLHTTPPEHLISPDQCEGDCLFSPTEAQASQSVHMEGECGCTALVPSSLELSSLSPSVPVTGSDSCAQSAPRAPPCSTSKALASSPSRQLFIHDVPASNARELHPQLRQPQHIQLEASSQPPPPSRTPSPSPSPYLALRTRYLRSSASRPISTCSEFSNYSVSTTASSSNLTAAYTPGQPLSPRIGNRLTSYPSTCLCANCVNYLDSQCIKGGKRLDGQQEGPLSGTIDWIQTDPSYPSFQSHPIPHTALSSANGSSYQLSPAVSTTTAASAFTSPPSRNTPTLASQTRSDSLDSTECESGLTEKAAADYYYYYRELELISERSDNRRRSQRAVLIQGLPVGSTVAATPSPGVIGNSPPTSNAQVGSLEYLSLIEGLDPKSRQYQRNKAASKRRRALSKKDEDGFKRSSWIRFRSWVSLLLDAERNSEADSEQQQHEEAALEELQQQWRQFHLCPRSFEGTGEQRPPSPPESTQDCRLQQSSSEASSPSSVAAVAPTPISDIASSHAASSLAPCPTDTDNQSEQQPRRRTSRNWTTLRTIRRNSRSSSRASSPSYFTIPSIRQHTSSNTNSSTTSSGQGDQNEQRLRPKRFLSSWRRLVSSSTPNIYPSSPINTPASCPVSSNSSLSTASQPITSPSTLSPSPSPSLDSVVTSLSIRTPPTDSSSSRPLYPLSSAPSLPEQYPFTTKITYKPRASSTPPTSFSPSSSSPSLPKLIALSPPPSATKARSEIMIPCTSNNHKSTSTCSSAARPAASTTSKIPMRPSTPTPRHPLAEVTFSEECDGIRISEEETLETENQASLQQPSQLFVPPGGDSYSAATDKTTCTPKSPASVSVKSLGIEFESPSGRLHALVTTALALDEKHNLSPFDGDKTKKLHVARRHPSEERLTAALAVNTSVEQPRSPVVEGSSIVTRSSSSSAIEVSTEPPLSPTIDSVCPLALPTALQDPPLPDSNMASSSMFPARQSGSKSSVASFSALEGEGCNQANKRSYGGERSRPMILRIASSQSSVQHNHSSDTGPSTPLQRPQPPRSASCDERSWSVGPPDPVPDYYRHLQVRRDNRRRRSAPLLRSSPPSCTSSSQFLIGGPTPSGAPSIAMVMDTSTVTTAMEEGGSDLAGLEIGSTSRATRGAGAVDGQRARSSTLQGPYSRDSQEAEEVIAQGGEQGQQPQRPDRRLIRRSMSVLGLQPNLSSLFGKLITTVSSVLPPAHHASVASGVTSESGDSGVSAANGNSSSSSSNLAELAYHTRQQSMTSRRSQELLHNPVVEVGGRISISGRNTPTRDPYEHLRRHPMYQQRLYFYSDCDDDEQLVQQAQSQLHQQPAQAQSSPDSLQRQKQPLEQYQTASQVHEQPLQYTENPMSPSLSPSDRFHSRVCSEATSDHTPPNHTDGNDDEHRHEHGDDDEEEDVGHESLSSRTAAPEDPEDDDDDLPYPRNERVRDDIAADQANQALEEEEEILVASSTSSRPTLSFQRTASALSVASSTLEIPTGAQPSFVDAPPAYATAVASTLKDSTPTSANSTAGTNARRRSEELLRPSSSTSAVHALARASADGFGTIRTSLSSASTTPASTSAHGIPVVTPKKPLTLANLNLSNPPSYWEAVIKYRGFPKIQPRPEESNEILPRYSCSVFREGCINRKTELIGSWRPYRRPWKRTFAHLRGTSLRLYAVDEDDVPRVHIRNISLQLARCELASDYKQRQYVIRIRSTDRTMLMECKDRIDALTWIEYLQAAANIATPLEERCMPKFYTLGRPGGPTSHRSNAHRQDQQQQNSANAGSSSASSQQQAAQTAQREAEELEAQRAHQRSRTTTSAAPRSLSSSSSSIAAASSASPPSPCCTSPPLNPTKHCEHEVDSQSSSQHHDHQHRAQHSQSPHQDHLPAMLSDHRRASSANGVPSSSASSSNSSSLSRSSTNGGIRSLLLRRIGHGNLPASPSPLSSQSRAGEEDGSSGDNGGNHATAEPRPSMERHHSHHHHQDQRRRDRRTVTTLADLARAAGVVAQDHAMPSATSAGSPLMAGQRGVGTGTASIATAAATATTMTASAVAVADDEQVMRAFLQSLGHDDDGDTYRTRSRTLDLSRDRRREHSHQQQEQSSSRALHNDGEDSEEDDDDDEDENMLDDEDIDVEELVERHRRRIRQREQRQRERERRRAAAVAATEAALMMQSSGHGCGRGNLALAETTTTPTTIWRRHSVDMIRRHGGGGGGASGSMHLSVSSSASNSPRSSWHRPLRVLHQLLGQSTTTAVSSVAVVGQSSLQ